MKIGYFLSFKLGIVALHELKSTASYESASSQYCVNHESSQSVNLDI